MEEVTLPPLPENNTVPKLVQPPLDFLANLPQLPIDQKPFTPPPPATQPKVPELLAAAQPALDRMGKIGAYRIGASPVSEWYVKPHVERRTGRTSLDGNVDFSAAALEFKPYAEVAQNLVIESATGINDMFGSLQENWQNFSSTLSESLTFPNNPDLPAIQNALPTEPVEVSAVAPTAAWTQIQKAAWQYRGLMPELEAWENWVLNTDPVQQEAHEKWLKSHRLAWNQYQEKLVLHQTILEKENRALAKLASADKLGFWESPQALALVPSMGRQFTADDTPDLNFSIPNRNFVSTPLSIDLPDESTFDYSYYNTPGFNLPGNTAAELLETGVVSNAGDGSLNDKEKEDLKNAGLKPGMYYAKNEATGVDLLHKVRFYGEEAQTAGDLDGDGSNEVLYTLRQKTVYIKRSPTLAPAKIKSAAIKQLTQSEFLGAAVPLKTFDITPFWNDIVLDIEPYGTLDEKYYEWQLRSKVDGRPEIMHGILTHSEIEPASIQAPLAKALSVTGEAKVTHLSRVDLPVESVEACLACEPFQIYHDDVLIRAGHQAATLWTYSHPLRGREAKEKIWTLEPGEALRLKAADICLTAGAATKQATDEEEFSRQSDLAVGEGFSAGSVLTLADGARVEVRLADESLINIEGPLTYYFHQVDPGIIPDTANLISYDRYMTYNALRTYKNGKPTIWQPLNAHPSKLPWQN